MKVLFVGLGSIGQRHLRNLSALGVASELIAYRATRHVPVLGEGGAQPEGPTLAERYGLIEVETLAEGLARGPALVFVCNPSSLHLEVALAAAEAGAHLFLEKPLATEWEGVARLEALVAEKGLVVTVGFQLRYDPGIEQIAAWLRAGRLGRVASALFVNGEYLPDMHPWEDYRSGYAARRDLGGGNLHTQCHDLDLARWLFGMPRRVFALGGQRSELELDVEDSTTLLMDCVSEGQSGGRVPVTIQLDYLRRPSERRLSVVGELGRIEWDHPSRRATLIPLEGEPEVLSFSDFQRNQLFEAELNDFLAAFAGGAPPRVGLAAGLDCLRIALAAHRSLETGQAVDPRAVS